MVKFGAHFSSVQDPELADTGVPYKRLKKLIKQLESMQYAEVAQHAVAHVSEGGLRLRSGRVQDLEHEFVGEIRASIERLNKLLMTQLPGAGNDDEKQRLLAFAELNHTALIKIAKKFRKKVGARDELQQTIEGLPDQPFCSVCDGIESPRLGSDRGPTPGAQVVSMTPEQYPQAGLPEAAETPGDTHRMQLLRFRMFMQLLPCRMFMQLIRFRTFMLSQIRSQSKCCMAFVILGCLTSSLGFYLGAVTQGWVGPTLKGCGLLTIAYAVLVYVLHNLQKKPQPKPEIVYRRWAQGQHWQLGREFQQEWAFQRMCVHISKNDDAGKESFAEPVADRSCSKTCHVLGAEFDISECACCFSSFEPDDKIALLPCAHVFHEECVVLWASMATKASEKCPLCRSDFADVESEP